MRIGTSWAGLREDVRESLLDHYTGIECSILQEITLAGLRIVDTDYCDDTWARYYAFESEAELGRFLLLVEFENHPSGQSWDSEIVDSQFRVWIPRMDLHPVLQSLQRINAVVVTDYERKKRQLQTDMGRMTARVNAGADKGVNPFLSLA